MSSPVAELAAHVARLWAPPPELTCSEWADKYRYLSPESSAAPGKWKTLPYQREPLNAVSDSRVRSVVIKSATQMLKTVVIENAIGYFAHQDPGPILALQPGGQDAKDFSKERIAPMIRDTPVLKAIFSESKSRNSDSTITEKLFPGGLLAIAGAGSARNVARRAIRILVADEVDKNKDTSEGNSLALARKRMATFGHRAKEIITCSPTLPKSEIDRNYEASDKREFFVPCPFCGRSQSMMGKFHAQVRWERTREGQPLSREEQALTARYHCESCDKPWDDAQRMAAVERGEWIAQAAFTGVAGFWISELYSPWKRLSAIVLDFLLKKDTPSELVTFVNTSLAENWVEHGEAPKWKSLYDRAELYEVGVVPDGGLVLTAAVDVQEDRLEFEVKAWGRRGRENWSVYYEEIAPTRKDSEGRTIPCRTSDPEPWARLAELIARDWPVAGGGTLPLMTVAIDTGYRPEHVYRFCRKYPQPAHGPAGSRVHSYRTVIPVKGGHSPFKLIEGVSPTDAAKKRLGLKIITIGTHYAKQEIYDALRIESPVDGGEFPPGYCHHPKYKASYFQGLCAETRIVKTNGDVEWRKDGRNEPLDLHVYNRAAAELSGIAGYNDAAWNELERRLRASAQPAAPPDSPEKTKPKRTDQVSGFYGEPKQEDTKPLRPVRFKFES
jgi:phage terminase large subunit GpA-like protein